MALDTHVRHKTRCNAADYGRRQKLDMSEHAEGFCLEIWFEREIRMVRDGP